MFHDFVLHAISNGETDFEHETCEQAQKLLTRFNWEINSLIKQHRLAAIGDALWYLYSYQWGFTADVLDDSVSGGYSEFYHSLEFLYDKGFATHCVNCRGHSDFGKNHFATACYMLWDMDSGLDYLSFHGSPERFKLVSQLIDFGLRHHHAAVQESFLHCLGHRRNEMADFVDSKLIVFLQREDISPEIREYAIQCRTGRVA